MKRNVIKTSCVHIVNKLRYATLSCFLKFSLRWYSCLHQDFGLARKGRASSLEMMRGDSLHKMRPTTREMYLEIYRRVCSIKKEQPNKPLSEIVFQVVGQPAPQFYLTPDSARVIVTKIKRRFYEKNKKRLRHMFNSI